MATTTNAAPTPEDIAALRDEVLALKRELDDLARDRQARAQQSQAQDATIAKLLADIERLNGNANANTAAVAKLTEQRRANDIVRLGERVAGLDIGQRDRAVKDFVASNLECVPYYGAEGRAAAELGGRDIYEHFKRVMKREHLDGRRQGDRDYAARIALTEAGVTIANAKTLHQAMLLAEGEETIRLDEEQRPRAARAAARVFRERPDLCGGYGPQGTAGDHVVQASEQEQDPAVQDEIDDIKAELETLGSQDATRRQKLQRRLARLTGVKPGDYGWGSNE
jgi:hypothetical protein